MDSERFGGFVSPACFLLVMAIALSRAAAAFAADAGDAEALIREGVALRRAGSDVRALPLFQKAHEIAHTPRTAAQLGLVEFALGYSMDSEQHLSQGLAVPTDPWIAKNRALLEDTLAQVRATIGEVVLTGGPDGAEVTVNGRPAGRLPLGVPVRAGQGLAALEVKAAGYQPFARQVEVVGGKRTTIAIQLQPEAPMLNANAMPAPARADGDSGAAPASQPERHSGLRTAAWLTGAGALVALGLGVAYQVVQSQKFSDFDKHCGVNEKGQVVPDSGGTASGCSSLYQTWENSKTWPIVGYATGGALAVATGVLFVLARPSHQPQSDQTALLDCRAGIGSIACQIAF